jgi:hypothetical protein
MCMAIVVRDMPFGQVLSVVSGSANAVLISDEPQPAEWRGPGLAV